MQVSSLVRKFSIAVVLSLTTASISLATNISASSSGYGLDAHISALGLNLNAGPLPVGASGIAPAPYNTTQTTLNVNTTGNIPVVVGGNISANSVTGTAFSNVDGLSGSRTTSAGGGVVGANIGTTTLPVIPPGVTLLGLNGTLSSTAQIVGDFGSLVATGTTTIQSLGLTINGINVNLSPYVGVSVPANTSVNLAALGIANSTLILNEQIIAGDNSSISVNALRLSVNLVNLITANVVLGHSQAQMSAAPEPGCLSLVGLAMIGFISPRRRHL